MRGLICTSLVLATYVASAGAQQPAQVDTFQPVVTYAPNMTPFRFWFDTEYFLGWIKSDPTPGTLLTSGFPSDPDAGKLGFPGTSVLVDGSRLNYGLHSGLRLALGGYFGPAQALGMEVTGFMLETHTIHYERDSNMAGMPVIARPFFNTFTGVEDSMQIATSGGQEGPGRFGGIDIFSDSRTWGGEANGIILAWLGRGRWDIVTGFRYLGQKDELRFSQASTILNDASIFDANALGFQGALVPIPNILSLKDFIETNNDFYGAQFGFRTEYQFGNLSVNVGNTFAFGTTIQKLNTEGWTMNTFPSGTSLLAPGGLYIVGKNLGDFERVQYSFVTESTVRLGLQITERLRTNIGYRFLFWDNVIRPGQQIDRRVDPRQVPSDLSYIAGFSGSEPDLLFRSSSFWLQGITMALVLEF